MAYENSVEDMAFDLMDQAEREGDLFSESRISTSNKDILNNEDISTAPRGDLRSEYI